MGEYTGSNMAACWNGISIPQILRIDPNESRPRGKLDATHSGDSTGQSIDDIPDPTVVTVTISGYDWRGSDSVLAGSQFNPGTSGSLDIAPLGWSGSANPTEYCHAMNLDTRNYTRASRELNTFELTFTNLASGSWSTGTVGA